MEITFKAFSFRKIESPYDKDQHHTHTAVVEARDLPDLTQWTEVNLRGADPKGRVYKQILDSANQDPEMFFFMNRGLYIVAKSVSFDNKAGEVTIRFVDKEKHGLADGGHTYDAIRKALQETTENWTPLYVTLQIVSGFDSEEIADVVEARNTSRQVSEACLANGRNKFDRIKDVLAGQPYENKIAYYDSDIDLEGDTKPIGIREIVSYLICFDIEGFDEDSPPVSAYGSKKKTLQYYLDNQDRMARLAVLLPTILALRDHIYRDFPEEYEKFNNGKFGKLTGVKVRSSSDVPLHFIGDSSRFVIPGGFIYPVLAAFRSLVSKPARTYVWTTDPLTAFDLHKGKLLGRLRKPILDYKNPNKFGKDSAIWNSAHDVLVASMARG